MKLIIYLSLVLAIFVVGGSTLRCYICSSQSQKNCGHGTDVDSGYVKECKEEDGNPPLGTFPNGTKREYTLCRKMVTKVDFDVNGNKATDSAGIIKRACGYDDDKYVGECYYRGGLGGRIDVCTCTKDSCNGSNKLGNVLALSLVPIVLVLAQVLRS